MKTYGEVESFLISALDGGEWSASRPGRSTPWERALGIHWTGSWVGPRVGQDAVVNRKMLLPCRESNPCRPAFTELPRLHQLPQKKKKPIARVEKCTCTCSISYLLFIAGVMLMKSWFLTCMSLNIKRVKKCLK
jgi:hypothetical protein